MRNKMRVWTWITAFVAASALVLGGGVVAATSAGADTVGGILWVNNDTTGASYLGYPQPQRFVIASDIALWGQDLGAPSGTFSVLAIPPSGTFDQVLYYPTTWSYDQLTGGPQVIAIIQLGALLNYLHRAGDTTSPVYEPGVGLVQAFHLEVDVQAGSATRQIAFWLIPPQVG